MRTARFRPINPDDLLFSQKTTEFRGSSAGTRGDANDLALVLPVLLTGASSGASYWRSPITQKLTAEFRSASAASRDGMRIERSFRGLAAALPRYHRAEHLVKLQVRRQINLINAILGYGPVEIVSPPEL